MLKLTTVPVAICLTLQIWAQVPQDQGSPSQKVAGQTETMQASTNQVKTTSKSPFDEFQDFSAIQNGGPLPGMDEDRYIYRSGNLMRTQSDAAVPEYYVTDLVKQECHAVAARACLQMNYADKRSFPFFITGKGSTYERTVIGEDNLDGHKVRIEDVTIHNPKNPVVVQIRLYEAEDLHGFPIKIENHREHAYPWVIQYKDVRVAPQDPSLFIVPEKCQTTAGFKAVGPKSKPKTAPSQKQP
jgi:hypothetical protein